MKSIQPFLLLGLLLPVFASAQTRHTGEIAGAEYIVDVPTDPNGTVMFIARGFRPSFFPLSPVYESDTTFYQTLLSEGWTIASTAFQTNDWVVAEGAEDILALQAYIAREIHPIERSFLYGETMGGGVATWLAEQRPEFFEGALALGAHLFPEPVEDAPQSNEIAEIFTTVPKIPILFIANTGEFASSRAYIAETQNTDYPPVLWAVDRVGHVNVNSVERLAAMRALVDWAEGTTIAESVEDATITLSPASVAAIRKESAASQISRIRPLYGNIYTHFVAQDLVALGIQLGDTFQLTHRNTTVNVTFAKAYSDVPYGEWVAFIDYESHVQISRNYANAAETLAVNKGDALLITKGD